MFRRNQNTTTIEYIYITNQSDFGYFSYITLPDEFNSDILSLIRTLPADFLQIFNSQLYFEFKCNEIINSSLNFNVLYFKDFENYFEQIKSENIRVFIIDNKKNKNYNSIFDQISTLNNTYFTCLKKELEGIQELGEKYSNTFFCDVDELIFKIKRDKQSIIYNFKAQHGEQNVDIQNLSKLLEKNNKHLSPMEKIPVFKGAHQNFFVKNQINSNIWFYKDKVDHSQDFMNNKRNEFLLDSSKGRDSFSRLVLLAKQILEIDEIHGENIIPIGVSDIDPLSKPLIITLPYHNPQENQLSTLFEIKIPKEIKKFLLIEQDKNYLFTTEISDDPNSNARVVENTKASLREIIYPRLQYLDFISYLHSTFTLSPILRLPFLGKSIKRELSFLKPNSKNNLKGTKLNKTIKLFGNKLKDLVLINDLENQI